MFQENPKFYFDYENVTALYALIDAREQLVRNLIFEIDPGKLDRFSYLEQYQYIYHNGKIYVHDTYEIFIADPSRLKYVINFPSTELTQFIAQHRGLKYKYSSENYISTIINLQKEIFNYFYKKKGHTEINRFFYLLTRT